MPNTKQLYPIGARVLYEFSWFGRTSPHHKHECTVLTAEITRGGNRNRKYFKYRLLDTETNTEFNVEDAPPKERLTLIERIKHESR